MKNIRTQFTPLREDPNLAYLDSAATALVPDTVVDAISTYYKTYPANVHRGMYDMSIEATKRYESARKNIAEFIGASSEEVVFTSGATAGLNMVAQMLKSVLRPGDNIVMTRYEHHANMVPWQKAADEIGCELRFIDLFDEGEGVCVFDVSSVERCVDSRTKVVAYSAASHVLGTIAPMKMINDLAHSVGALTVVDAAQLVAHRPVNVKNSNCDFLVFSGHKLYGPTGVGVLYVKKELLDRLEPSFFGGGMVENVTYDSATWAEGVRKFEAGTPSISAVIALGTAVDFIKKIGWGAIVDHENTLTNYAWSLLKSCKNIAVLGPPEGVDRIAVFSFVIPGVHAHDVAELCNRHNVAIRAGHHCAIPLVHYLGAKSVGRISFGVYTEKKDLDQFFEALKDVIKIFSLS